MSVALIVSGLGGLLLLVGFAVLSHREAEPVACRRALWVGVIWAIPSGVALITGVLWLAYFALGLGALALVGMGFALLPTGRPRGFVPVPYPQSVDERNIMFSRAALEPGSERYTLHYDNHPEHIDSDRRFRAKPGLLSAKALKAEPLGFAAAEASFRAIGELSRLTEGEPAEKQIAMEPQQASDFLKGWARKLGALDAGVTELKPEHCYTVKGRGELWGEAVQLDHGWALAISVEMDHRQLASAPDAPTIMESAQQYMASGAIAVQIAEGLRQLGWRAEAHIDANYKVICPFVARDAGLGEIGRMGLVMTPGLGPRVRFAVVTTDLPLVINESGADPSVLDFCSICEKCADMCPADAIVTGPRLDGDGALRWKINQEACFTYWCSIGTDCGQCIRVCPYSHPDTFMHNMVREGIRRSSRFRKVALVLDDFFYGRRPASQPSQN